LQHFQVIIDFLMHNLGLIPIMFKARGILIKG